MVGSTRPVGQPARRGGRQRRAAQPVEVAAPWLAGRSVQSIRVSHDGARIAVVSADATGTRVEVAGIVRDAKDLPTGLSEPVRVGAPIKQASQVVWADETLLAVLGSDGTDAAASVHLVAVGGGTTPLTPVPGTVAVSAGNGERSVQVLTKDGTLFGRSRSGPSGRSGSRASTYRRSRLNPAGVPGLNGAGTGTSPRGRPAVLLGRPCTGRATAGRSTSHPDPPRRGRPAWHSPSMHPSPRSSPSAGTRRVRGPADPSAEGPDLPGRAARSAGRPGGRPAITDPTRRADRVPRLRDDGHRALPGLCAAAGRALEPSRGRRPRLDRLDGTTPLPVWALAPYAAAPRRGRGVEGQGRVDLTRHLDGVTRRAGRASRPR
ncbi:LpqB family beta-propeller domain-containing protein [Oerskovia sp. M15]